MQIPRFARIQRIAALAVLLVGLTVPSLARADPLVRCARQVVVKLRSPYENSPPNKTPPLVVKWPHHHEHHHEHHHHHPPPPPPETSPEPASLLTGLLGSGLFALFTWWRKRTRGRATAALGQEVLVFSPEDEPQLAMAA